MGLTLMLMLRAVCLGALDGVSGESQVITSVSTSTLTTYNMFSALCQC